MNSLSTLVTDNKAWFATIRLLDALDEAGADGLLTDELPPMSRMQGLARNRCFKRGWVTFVRSQDRWWITVLGQEILDAEPEE